MVAGRNLAALAVAVAGYGVVDAINFFGAPLANPHYLQPREVTVTVTEQYCPPETPNVPVVDTSVAIPPAQDTPSTNPIAMTSETPETPVIPPGGAESVPATTSVPGDSVPATPGYPEFPGTEVTLPAPTTTVGSATLPTTALSTGVQPTTAIVSSRPVPSTATTAHPSTTTLVTGGAALTSVNVGVLALVALAAMHQVY